MSIRYHRGVPIVTLFHDPASPASQQVLRLLQSALSRPSSQTLHDAATKDTPVIDDGPLDIRLEVNDKSQTPPTSDQMRSIASYLREPPSAKMRAAAGIGVNGPERGGSEVGGASAATAGDSAPSAGTASGKGGTSGAAAAIDATSASPPTSNDPSPGGLAGHLAPHQAGSMSSIRYPIVVDWEGGRAATDLEGVQAMLQRLREEQSKEKARRKSGAGWTCDVM